MSVDTKIHAHTNTGGFSVAVKRFGQGTPEEFSTVGVRFGGLGEVVWFLSADQLKAFREEVTEALCSDPEEIS